jgi:hypothetical protein
MRVRLRTVIETEHCCDNADQLIRQMDRSGPSAIRAAIVLEGLQVHSKCIIELSNGAGEDYGSARRIFVDDRETMTARELPDRCNVAGFSSELLCELLTLQVVRPFAGSQLSNPILQSIAGTMPEDYADFQAFRGIRPSSGPRAPQWLSLTADKRLLWHG